MRSSPCNFPLLWLSGYELSPQYLAQFHIPSSPAHCSLLICVCVPRLQGNNPTVTNSGGSSSAPKFTLAARLSSAVKEAWGGQTCSEIYRVLNVVYTQTWNYLSVWVEKGAKQHYSNHLGWCQRTPSCLFAVSGWFLRDSVKNVTQEKI